jgi:hypothetical protein
MEHIIHGDHLAWPLVVSALLVIAMEHNGTYNGKIYHHLHQQQ